MLGHIEDARNDLERIVKAYEKLREKAEILSAENKALKRYIRDLEKDNTLYKDVLLKNTVLKEQLALDLKDCQNKME
uniref:IF rod domain-containing protein n=1 Tax=Rhabditophanes sp. KR3021 TaxID=114890 RepID=A0AC35TLQ5_9BILA